MRRIAASEVRHLFGYDPATVIHRHGTRYYLGGFTSKEAAHAAYLKKAQALFGDFARGG